MDNIDDFLNELYENWIDLVIDNVPLVQNFNSNHRYNVQRQRQENSANSNLFGMLDLLRNAQNASTNAQNENNLYNLQENTNGNGNGNFIDILHNSNREIINNFINFRTERTERTETQQNNENERELESESQFFEIPLENTNFTRRNDGRYPLNNDISNLVTDLFGNIFDYINEPEFEDVKVTISKNDFEELQTIILTKENILKYEDKSCIICLEHYKIKDKIKILSCDHIFHENCIYQWLCKEKISCPICRKDIRKNDIS